MNVSTSHPAGGQQPTTSQPAPLVAVLGGCGGAGASTLATGLAVTAAGLGRKVLLVDTDPLGGGLDLLLGWETVPGARWPQLTGDGDGGDPARPGLPCRDGLAVVSYDHTQVSAVSEQVMATVLDSGRRSGDLVVVDTTRWAGPAGQLALRAADVCLLVVPARFRSALAARQVAALTGRLCPNVQLVIRGPVPAGLSVGQVVELLGQPLAGVLRHDRSLPAVVETGQAPAATGRGPLAVLCRRLLTRLLPSPGVRGDG